MREKQNQLLISAIICTYNRRDILVNAVESLLDQSLPNEQYEIIIVDNASTDATLDILSSIVDGNKQLNITVIKEPVMGLSYARNTGMLNAGGEIVAFIDDDAEANRNWLETIGKAFERNPEIAGVGGKVLPKFEGELPQWLDNKLFSYFSLLDLGELERKLTHKEYAIGTNMAFWKYKLLSIGGFNTCLGRKGNTLFGNEDTELQDRLSKKGGYFIYLPTAIVHHLVPRDRLTKNYIYKRAFWTGQTKASLIQQKGLFWVTVWKIIWNLGGLIWYSIKSVFSNLPTNRFYYRRVAVGKLGYLYFSIHNFFRHILFGKIIGKNV